jgi:hypothetical protein
VYFLLWVSGPGFSLFLWAEIFRPYIALTSTGLVVQNPVLRKEVKLDHIFTICVGYSGLFDPHTGRASGRSLGSPEVELGKVAKRENAG